MDLVEYAKGVLARRSEAVIAARATVRVDDWTPQPHHCHDNVVASGMIRAKTVAVRARSCNSPSPSFSICSPLSTALPSSRPARCAIARAVAE
jgi:hypothetical protein